MDLRNTTVAPVRSQGTHHPLEEREPHRRIGQRTVIGKEVSTYHAARAARPHVSVLLQKQLNRFEMARLLVKYIRKIAPKSF
jgi:hypothetical protein